MLSKANTTGASGVGKLLHGDRCEWGQYWYHSQCIKTTLVSSLTYYISSLTKCCVLKKLVKKTQKNISRSRKFRIFEEERSFQEDP